ncbi:efflux RND transporter periplasmic adaptor subunit [Rhodoferax sp.]|jgi:HlyD family secretion protein|uniref:efflux RND transporter periplasmic adaptor subunit n=1 Tax=Rhodoferax sp. TaxID=50421 RepID=UPI00378523AD
MKTIALHRTAVAGAATLALAAAGVSLALHSTSQAQNAPAAQAQARPSLTVTTARPAQTNWPLKLSANGNVAAWQEASVAAEVGGLRLADVRVDVGDWVTKGQVLAVFASESVRADLAQARAAAAEASANLADASANAERARSLANTGALSGQQTGQYLTGELTAQARLESARANLQQQELRLQQTQVLAPDSGMVVARSATVGAVANPGSELFRLIRQGRLEWRAEVTATELARIQTGGKVSVTTAAGTAVAGKVRKVGPTVDPQTRAALVYVDLSTPVRALSGVKAGMFARGEFELGNSNALVVPQQAVVVRDGFNYLFRIDASNKVAQRKVQIGRRINESVEITDGIGPDATIAVTGAGFLNDGDTVRVNNAASPK